MATSLRIEAPAQIQQIALALGSEGSDSDYPPPQNKLSKPRRNMKKLSLSLPSADYSVASLQFPLDPTADPPCASIHPKLSTISLPAINPTASLILRKDEDDGSLSVPYIDGPVQIIPGIWIGSEDNARDWKGLVERGIRSVLNVAKEVTSPFDSSLNTQALRPAMSTPNLRSRRQSDPTFIPPHHPTGKPAMYYLKLQWSHGQQNLVNDGFQSGMAFADAALKRGEGCLIQYVLSSQFHPPYQSLLQLPMWHLTICYHGHSYRYACRRRACCLGTPRGLGTEGYARSIRVCKRKKSLCRT